MLLIYEECVWAIVNNCFEQVLLTVSIIVLDITVEYTYKIVAHR